MKLAFYKDHFKAPSKVPLPVSVVICAHNEAINLRANLLAILQQDFQEFEVVVVNDASSDDTSIVLEEFKLQNTHLKIVTIAPEDKLHAGKKHALEVGLKAAKHSQVVLTDADCSVVSDKWISLMEKGLDETREIVLGYSPVVRRNGMLNAVIRYDVLQVGIQYLSFALWGIPYMGTGRNMAYKKKLTQQKSLEKHRDLLSGDDDLFINQVATHKNTIICIDRKAHMMALPKLTWKEYYKQKKRHFSTGIRYQKKHLLLLTWWNSSKGLFYISFLILLLLGSGLKVIFTLFCTYYIIHYIVQNIIAKKLGDRDLLLFIPFIDVISVFFNSFVIGTTFFSNSKQWK